MILLELIIFMCVISSLMYSHLHLKGCYRWSLVRDQITDMLCG